ncbi:hypothetical protein L1887_29836 [Cichorium endivia]|nr:hypothetical protein L1887_29836 [Cichorium endivia]
MVLQTQRCPSTPAQHHPDARYQQQAYSMYQESGGRIQDGGYTNFSAITGQMTPYSNYSQVSTYSSENSQHQSGGYHGGGVGVATTGLNQTSYHGHSQSHGHNGYGNGPSYGYQKHSWTLKNLDD